MQNSPNILIILLLFFTKHFHTILWEWPDWVCSSLTHADCTQNVVLAFPFQLQSMHSFYVNYRKKSPDLIWSLHQNVWTSVIGNLAKNYLLCPNPVHLSKNQYILCSFLFYKDTLLCCLLCLVLGYCIASRKPTADSSNNANGDSFCAKRRRK